MNQLTSWSVRGLLVLGCIWVGTGCVLTSAPAQENTNGKIQVVTSFYPLFFLASQIGGEFAQVKNITPAGAEPHDYEPTPQDLVSMVDSQLLILNGVHLEAWASGVTAQLSDHTVVVTAADVVADHTLEQDGNTMTDPHVWLSPRRAKLEARAITQGFMQVDPLHSAEYTKNEEALDAQLDQIDLHYQQGLAHCASSTIITSHSAFNYLASDYHFSQISIAGLSPDAEPSPSQIAAVADFAKANQIKYIFFESLISPKLSETIAQEIGAQTLVLDPLEGISDLDLQQGKNYVTVMEENLKNLRVALQCQ